MGDDSGVVCVARVTGSNGARARAGRAVLGAWPRGGVGAGVGGWHRGSVGGGSESGGGLAWQRPEMEQRRKKKKEGKEKERKERKRKKKIKGKTK